MFYNVLHNDFNQNPESQMYIFSYISLSLSLSLSLSKASTNIMSCKPIVLNFCSNKICLIFEVLSIYQSASIEQ